MTYIIVSAAILSIWATLRVLGGEREQALRQVEDRIRAAERARLEAARKVQEV